MLPKNRLGRSMIRKLHVVGGAEHPHAAQQPVDYTLGQPPRWEGLPTPKPVTELKTRHLTSGDRVEADEPAAEEPAAEKAAATKKASAKKTAAKTTAEEDDGEEDRRQEDHRQEDDGEEDHREEAGEGIGRHHRGVSTWQQ